MSDITRPELDAFIVEYAALARRHNLHIVSHEGTWVDRPLPMNPPFTDDIDADAAEWRKGIR